MVMFKDVLVGKINVHVFVCANSIMLLAGNPNIRQQMLNALNMDLKINY